VTEKKGVNGRGGERGNDKKGGGGPLARMRNWDAPGSDKRTSVTVRELGETTKKGARHYGSKKTGKLGGGGQKRGEETGPQKRDKLRWLRKKKGGTRPKNSIRRSRNGRTLVERGKMGTQVQETITRKGRKDLRQEVIWEPRRVSIPRLYWSKIII